MSAIVSRLRSYSAPNDPARTGYISFRNKLIPVDWSVPAAPYNKDLFVRDGSRLYYNDPAYTTEWGIDVSRHQGDIDWQKVAGAGVQFAIAENLALGIDYRYADYGRSARFGLGSVAGPDGGAFSTQASFTSNQVMARLLWVPGGLRLPP